MVSKGLLVLGTTGLIAFSIGTACSRNMESDYQRVAKRIKESGIRISFSGRPQNIYRLTVTQGDKTKTYTLNENSNGLVIAIKSQDDGVRVTDLHLDGTVDSAETGKWKDLEYERDTLGYSDRLGWSGKHEYFQGIYNLAVKDLINLTLPPFLHTTPAKELRIDCELVPKNWTGGISGF